MYFNITKTILYWDFHKTFQSWPPDWIMADNVYKSDFLFFDWIKIRYSHLIKLFCKIYSFRVTNRGTLKKIALYIWQFLLCVLQNSQVIFVLNSILLAKLMCYINKNSPRYTVFCKTLFFFKVFVFHKSWVCILSYKFLIPPASLKSPVNPMAVVVIPTILAFRLISVIFAIY